MLHVVFYQSMLAAGRTIWIFALPVLFPTRLDLCNTWYTGILQQHSLQNHQLRQRKRMCYNFKTYAKERGSVTLTCTVARSSPPCTTSFPDIFHCDTTCSGETVLATRLVLYWYTASWSGSHSSNAATVLTTSNISTMTTPACFTEQSGLRGLDLMPGQSMWDIWWIKCNCDRFFSKYLCFSITFIPPVGFVVDKVALWQVYLWVFHFPL